MYSRSLLSCRIFSNDFMSSRHIQPFQAQVCIDRLLIVSCPDVLKHHRFNCLPVVRVHVQVDRRIDDVLVHRQQPQVPGHQEDLRLHRPLRVGDLGQLADRQQRRLLDQARQHVPGHHRHRGQLREHHRVVLPGLRLTGRLAVPRHVRLQREDAHEQRLQLELQGEPQQVYDLSVGRHHHHDDGRHDDDPDDELAQQLARVRFVQF
mmetsp:Transcript_42616/g.49816  ORF Transcript_42616/g.49816 Transcript_42616/m.49816 type:complete len:206 (+) Transcript_42616:1300-1917(+)